ncbi:MAG: flagellin [SAR324 cluster bacterium]|nr:flagellin [SAR324 cluster bacterium]
MALRINHNISALNALRHLNQTDKALSGSLERLSSGERINRAADSPANMVISEQMRGQIASIGQAIQNSEASISMVQTAEAALNEVSALLISMRQRTIHAANEGANDEKMLAADQAEIENALDTIDRIARTSQFGTRILLDGSNGANGVAVGDGISFVSASPISKSSPADGYKINITRPATRAEKTGQRPINIEDLRSTDMEALVQSFRIMIAEGGKNISFDMENNEDGNVIRKLLAEMDRNPGQFDTDLVARNIRETIAENLQRKADNDGLKLEIFLKNEEDQVLVVRHRKFGSEHTFFVGASVGEVLPVEINRFEEAVPGRDVEGTIDGKIAVGEGELLIGAEATDTEGLVIHFDSVRMIKQRIPKFVPEGGEIVPNPEINEISEKNPPVEDARLLSKKEEGEFVVFTWEAPANVDRDPDGFVHLTQNSLSFQVGPTRGQQVKISLIDAKTNRLGTRLDNVSGFQSLKEIDVTDPQGAQDALLLLDDAITEISVLRADLGAFQKNTLESNAKSLRIAEENLISAESSIRDADMAKEMSIFTRNQVMMAAGMAMLAQANQTPKTVLTLLTNRGG